MPAAKSDEIRTDFQSIILNLQRYWAHHGAVILQPYDMEVVLVRFIRPQPCVHLVLMMFGARLMCSHHGVRLMAVYGENPNRLQHYYQFQVIFKPSPDEPSSVSGVAEGYWARPDQHDIRFVEDDWESPTLGRGGLAGRSGVTEWRSLIHLFSAGRRH